MRIIYLGLLLMGICILAFIISLIRVRHEEKLEKKRRMRAYMCRKTVREGLCPHCCDKCAWGGYEY